MDKKRAGHIVLRILKWSVLTVIGIIVVIPALLYIPFIQDVAKGIAISRIEESTGMNVNIDYLRLKFPLRVGLRGLTMIQKGDTVLAAGSADLDVAFWPLFKSEIQVSSASLGNASYRLNNADSAVFMTARIDRFTTSGTGLKFDMENINVGKTLLDGADITITIKDTITVTQPDTIVSRMIINAPDVELRNVTVRMRMLPAIDSLYAHIGNAHLRDGRMDMQSHTIDAGSLDIDSVSATYLLPTKEFLETYSPPEITVADSIALAVADAYSRPWQISVKHIGITGQKVTYTTRGAFPTPGLDMNYLEASAIKISVDSFYNHGSTIRMPISRFSATERCGISLEASGNFKMDSTSLHIGDFRIATPYSDVSISAMMGTGDLTADPNVPLRFDADGFLSLRDMYAAMPSLSELFGDNTVSRQINLDADISGTSGTLDIGHLTIDMPGSFEAGASGQIVNPTDFNRMSGRIGINGRIRDIDFIKNRMLAGATAKAVGIPPMTIDGKIDYKPGLIDGKLNISTTGGEMGLDARWNQKAEGYDLMLTTDRFPVQKFMPGLGIADLTADATVKGHGYDPADRNTAMTAGISLRHATFNGHSLDGITLSAALDTCRMTAHINSSDPDADLTADITAWLSPTAYEWDLSGDLRHIDLQALGLSDDTMNGSTEIYTAGSYAPHTGDIDAELNLTDFRLTTGSDNIHMPDATVKLSSTDTLTQISFLTGDFNASVRATCGLDTLTNRISASATLLSRQFAEKKIDVDLLQQTIPQIDIDVRAGNANPFASYLATASDIHFHDASLIFRNDSQIAMQTAVNGFRTGSTRLDSITFNLSQHGRYLVYRTNIDNKPGTMDKFAHISLNGYLAADKISALFKQSDINNRQGFFIGANATATDSTLTVNFAPYTPVIAYKTWKINRDNLVRYEFTSHHLDANLKLMSDSSSLHLYTEHTTDTLATGQEDVVLQLDNIKLADWLSISPFAPPVKGDLDANMRFRWNDDQITGNGIVDLTDLYYGRERVGTFRLDLDVANDSHTGALRANAGLLIDNVKVITASGNLNDSTAVHPFLLDFSMIHFPLRVVNPFLPKNVAQLSGMLNGEMDITGDLANPIFNGYLDFDSTAVSLGITGTSYAFSEEKIPVDSNMVRFNNFSIAGLNGNNLMVNGTVDTRKFSDVKIDLSMKASDMQIVNTSRPRGASVYGKAFIDLDATVNGNLRMLRVDADLDLLAGTNVTYVMSDAVETLVPQSTDGMVRFVQFADTTAVTRADSVTTSPMAIMLDARLAISDGSTINVDLSPDGKNKVSVSGAGNFTYTLSPISDTGRLTGRYTISSGFVRYTPQISTGGISMAIMSEKNFKFTDGSYIAFNGSMLNPTLNIKAVDRLKANVTQEGRDSRLVNFDIALSVTNTLENMNVAFDLSTNDDLTIQNELQAMSAEQRANQAMNLLLYNQYTGSGTKASANLSGNPLYTFLASQLNSWAANNIRGVDISFGIDQYDKTTDGSKSTTTSYSYRVSKTLFNDRFKIVVGGNYSTDADADENFSQNLINDISFEYMLNRSGSMYLRLFRHVGYESILEGEITQTGVGFVLKRKLNTLRDIFRFSPRTKEPEPTAIPVTTSPSDEK